METTQIIDVLLSACFQDSDRPEELATHLETLVNSLRGPLQAEYSALAHELELAGDDPAKLSDAAGKLKAFLQRYDSQTVLLP